MSSGILTASGRNGPEAVTEKPTKYERVLSVRARLATTFPLCFVAKRNPNKRPLKVGIQAEIIAALPDLIHSDLRAALFDYCHGPTYQRALASGGIRIDLGGQPAGEVTPEQAERARQLMAMYAERGFKAWQGEAA